MRGSSQATRRGSAIWPNAKENIDKDKDVAINVGDNIKDGKSGDSGEVL
jgi:hypothetical protein